MEQFRKNFCDFFLENFETKKLIYRGTKLLLEASVVVFMNGKLSTCEKWSRFSLI